MTKKSKIFGLLVILAGFLTVSCDWETSDNGDLDGMWQITDVDTLATGGHTAMKDSMMTWNFQGRILQVRKATGKLNNIYSLKFSHDGDRLTLYDPYRVDRTVDDELLSDADVDVLRPFAINSLTEQFRVIELSGSSMVLQSSMLKVRFRKY